MSAKTTKNKICLLGLVLIALLPLIESKAELLAVKIEPQFIERLQGVASTFQVEGTDAAIESIESDMQHPDKKALWQNFVQSSEVTVISVKAHPNEAKAIDWINKRFARMGLKNLQFEGAFETTAPDRTSLPEEQIQTKKWMRYLAGPGVAMAATVLAMPSQDGQSMGDYMLLMVPAAGVGVTTVLLELQFAWPYLNNKFWKKVWTFGGPVMGRITNTVVNFLYGMSLYGSGVLAANVPVLFGGEPIPFTQLPLLQAVTAAAVGGLTFHIAMGQFQTDIATEETRGSISGVKRYGLETVGVVVNNGARVLDWVLPLGISAYAQGAFFMLKTLPQLLKTNVSTWLSDLHIARELNPEVAPKAGIAEKCAELLSGLHLINLPKQRR